MHLYVRSLAEKWTTTEKLEIISVCRYSIYLCTYDFAVDVSYTCILVMNGAKSEQENMYESYIFSLITRDLCTSIVSSQRTVN